MKHHPEVDAVAELIAAAHATCLKAAEHELPAVLLVALQRLDRAVGALETLAEAKR